MNVRARHKVELIGDDQVLLYTLQGREIELLVKCDTIAVGQALVRDTDSLHCHSCMEISTDPS